MKMRSLTCAITLFFSLACIQAPVQAALVDTQSLTAAEQSATAQRQALNEAVMREDVQAKLLELGVNPADVQARIAGMTPAELNRLQGQLDQLPAGGDALGTVALVLLILILLDIAGVTDIFPGL